MDIEEAVESVARLNIRAGDLVVLTQAEGRKIGLGSVEALRRVALSRGALGLVVLGHDQKLEALSEGDLARAGLQRIDKIET